MSRRIEVVSKWWSAESSRHFMWLPVAFAGGIALYFGLPTEPPSAVLWWVALALCAVTIALRNRALVPCVAVLLIALGAAWASTSAHRTEHTRIQSALEPRPTTGTVSYIERTEHGVRLTLKNVNIKGLSPEETPENVRLSVRLRADSQLELPHIGEAIYITAGFRPPMGPALPHGFDFARYFYFRDIGAVGYGLPPWKIRTLQPAQSLADQFWDWRIRITEEILATVGPATGGIAAGLITGDARAISQEDFDALRASNLYHIIAISGEHMVVIAGVIFISLRLLALLVLPRRLAYRPEVKTFAAVLSLVLVTAYLFVTGLPISAVRAYCMIFLVLVAVIIRRQVDAMRSLAITAMVMLLWDPSNLLEPGFQLSFVATMAIIALVEATLLHSARGGGHEAGWTARLWRVVAAMLLVSVVAEAATMPLVIAMFNNVSPYGVLANMLATALVSFYLMPTVALYFILLPFGLQSVALWLMNWGIKGLLGIAHWVAGFPYAQLFLPSIPAYGVVLVVFGLLWICLWRARARRYGAIAMLLGIATISFNHPPAMLVGGELKQLAFKTEQGYVLARGRRGSMVPNLWANGLGYKELPKAGAAVWECETRNKNCVAHMAGQRIAFPADDEALAKYCTQAELIFTTQIGAQCENGVRVIDGSQLHGSNVMALWVNADGSLRLEKSADWQGSRPWSAIVVDDDASDD